MLSKELLGNLLLFAGMAILAGILLLRIIRRLGKSRRGKPNKKGEALVSTRRAATGYSQPLADAPPELTRWQVEMHEVARDLKAELDTKICLMQTLLGVLREEIGRLETLLERARREGLTEAADVLSEIERLSESLSRETTASLRQAEAAAEQLQEAADPAAMLDQDVCRRVYAMSDEGRTNAEIAAELVVPQGEVDLALSLRRTKASTDR